MSDPRDKDGFRDFADETREMLEQMEQDLVRIGGGERDAELLNSLFRSAHTIKGTSGMYDFHAVAEFVHSLENVLDRVRSGRLELTDQLIAAVLHCKDHLLQRMSLYESGHYENDETLAEADGLIQSLATAAGGVEAITRASADKQQARRASDQWKISVSCKPGMFVNGLDPYPFFRFLAERGHISEFHCVDERLPPLSQLDPTRAYLAFDFLYIAALTRDEIVASFEFARQDIDLTVEPATPGTVEKAPEARPTPPAATTGEPRRRAADRRDEALQRQAGRTIRVDADKLDLVVDHVGEAVVVASAIQQMSIDLKNEFLEELSHRLTQLLSEIRMNSLKLRMVPVDTIFRRFTRVVYEMGLQLGKPARLEIQGGETELDKNIIDHLTDPLTHMVRNAMDHGIESSAEERTKAGKAAEATILLSAYHRAGEVVVEVSDDGRGMDTDHILAHAEEVGLHRKGDVIREDQIYRFLFEPGFSTAETVTELSGRGVGLDVVRKNVEALRGRIEVQSVRGQGTMFRIVLPLTLANIDGFLLRVGNNQYAIPLDMVNECMEFRPDQFVVGEQNYIRVRGNVMPFINMNEWFGEPSENTDRRNLVIVRAGNIQAGLVVDALLGRMHSVIKPLGDLFGGTDGVSGFAVMGDGSVAMILDTSSLIVQVKRFSEELAQLNLEKELTIADDESVRMAES